MKYLLIICGDESVQRSQDEGQALELASGDAERRHLSQRLAASVRDAQPS